MAKNTEPSAKTRTTSSIKYWKLNPSDVDDTTVEALKGFKQAKDTESDPAYGKIIGKCSKSSLGTFTGRTHPTLTPPKHETYEEFKDWSRGKMTEKP